MGINFDEFVDAVNSEEARQEIKTLKEQFEKLPILSIDRLDYTKGIISVLGYYEFLEKSCKAWEGKSSYDCCSFKNRGRQIQPHEEGNRRKVGNLNGRFGTIHWTPVIYQYRFIPFYPLAGLYKASDVSLVTPLRDGMNLIAKNTLPAEQMKPAC
jgi:trehalose 6-phosphate synthase/phosphatase